MYINMQMQKYDFFFTWEEKNEFEKPRHCVAVPGLCTPTGNRTRIYSLGESYSIH